MTFEPNPCAACLDAHQRLSHLFHAGCIGCAARAVCRGPNFRRAFDSGMQDWRYRDELRMFGLTHDQVKAEAAMDQLTRRQAEKGASRVGIRHPATAL